MNFVEYFAEAGAPSPLKFAADLGMGTEAAARQWAKDPTRRPGPEWAPAAEALTGFKVRLWDMYPDKWWRIWPWLIGAPGAPEVPRNDPLLPLLRRARANQAPPA